MGKGTAKDPSKINLYAPKVFMERILPKDIMDAAMEQYPYREKEDVEDTVPLALMQNLKAEFLSMEQFMKAHTKYIQFLDVLSQTSPSCHRIEKIFDGAGQSAQSSFETEIADKMERNAFRKRKMGACKIIINSACRASDGLMEVLTFAGGWLTDGDGLVHDEGIGAGIHTGLDVEEAELRAEEMEEIRCTFLPMAVFMLHEVLDKTAKWLEQVVHDTLDWFCSEGKGMILALLGSFDETIRSEADESYDVLKTSQAAPCYWYKKALSLEIIVADDGNGLKTMFSGENEIFD